MPVGITARTPATFLRKVWEIVSGQNASTFMIISANRGSLPPEENHQRDAQLRGILRSLGLRVIPLAGIGQEVQEQIGLPVTSSKRVNADQVVRSKEKSYLVAGVSRAQAEALCAQFDQDAVVFGQDGTANLLWRDPASNTFTVQYLGGAVMHRGKTYDPVTRKYVSEAPGSATFRSEGLHAKGVGFTFYNDDGVVDEIHNAAQRLRAEGKISQSAASVQRLWMDLAKRAETATNAARETGDEARAEKAALAWKNVVRQAARDPEGVVLHLVGAQVTSEVPA